MNEHKETLVVFEPVPRWAALLERAFADSGEWKVARCPHWIDLPERLGRAGTIGCLLVIDESDVSRNLLPLIPQIASTRAVFVIAPPAAAEAEWQLREAGVDSFVETSISLRQLVRIVRRRLQSVGSDEG